MRRPIEWTAVDPLPGPTDAGATSLRLELFVDEVERSIRFYRDVLAFAIRRNDPDYASLRRGGVVLGIGPVGKLPESGGCFTRSRLAQERGLGVEIVLEVDDVAAAYDRVRASGHPVRETLQDRPWGLTDFRITDPDGYYLRITSRDRRNP